MIRDLIILQVFKLDFLSTNHPYLHKKPLKGKTDGNDGVKDEAQV